jgi:protein-S-isoprenylcysteine O-methyltransferase Ste14
MTVLLVLVCAALVWLAASSFWSIAFPERRTYPADRREGLVFRFNSPMGPGASIGLFIVSVGGWNSLVLDGWLRFGVGSVLLALGVYFSLGGVFKLGMDRTHGIAGELLEDGPYRFTRNPQYVGSLMGYTGLGLLCASAPGLATTALSAAWFLSMPFAEEPWLRAKLGAPYEAYMQRVPRYLPLPRIRPR